MREKMLYVVLITPVDDSNTILEEISTGHNILVDAKTWMDSELGSEHLNLEDGEYLTILRCKQGTEIDPDIHYVKNIDVKNGNITLK